MQRNASPKKVGAEETNRTGGTVAKVVGSILSAGPAGIAGGEMMEGGAEYVGEETLAEEVLEGAEAVGEILEDVLPFLFL